MIKNKDLNQDYQEKAIKTIMNRLKETKPERFDEAYNHPDEKFRNRWQMSFKLEFASMDKRKVWTMRKKSKIPKGR